MNALRNVKKQLEGKSDDIKKKCDELLFLQERCEQLERRCKEQARLLDISKFDQPNIGSSKMFDVAAERKYLICVIVVKSILSN